MSPSSPCSAKCCARLRRMEDETLPNCDGHDVHAPMSESFKFGGSHHRDVQRSVEINQDFAYFDGAH